jgi:hypothetical protein
MQATVMSCHSVLLLRLFRKYPQRPLGLVAVHGEPSERRSGQNSSPNGE